MSTQNPWNPPQQPADPNQPLQTPQPTAPQPQTPAMTNPLAPPPSPMLTQPSDNFFKSLFDLSFNRWITPSVVKFIFLLSIILVGLAVLINLAATLLMGDTSWIILSLILAPLVGLIVLALIRVGLETSVALIRIAENTKALRDSQSR